MNLLLGRQVRIVPPTVPPRPRPLPPTSGRLLPGHTTRYLLVRPLPTLARPAIGPVRILARVVAAVRVAPGPFLRSPEGQPGQLRHLLGQRLDLALQLDDPVPQLRCLRPGLLGLNPPALRLGTPEPDVATTEIAVAHDRPRRSPPATQVQHPNPACCDQGARHDDHSYGITEYLLGRSRNMINKNCETRAVWLPCGTP